LNRVFRIRTNRISATVKLLALAGVLLVAFSGFAQAVHVHADDSKLPSHECSLCSVAHSGAVVSIPYQPSPMFTLAELFIAPESVQLSSGFLFSLRIRPPPAA
jgi:hypothetical protein